MPRAPSRFDPITERRAYGRARRDVVARGDHAKWSPRAGRDSIALLQAAERGRLTDLLPIKYGRMAASPFAFFRGSAPVMAWDLSQEKHSTIAVQLCGDAHVRNLGAFAAPD